MLDSGAVPDGSTINHPIYHIHKWMIYDGVEIGSTGTEVTDGDYPDLSWVNAKNFITANVNAAPAKAIAA